MISVYTPEQLRKIALVISADTGLEIRGEEISGIFEKAGVFVFVFRGMRTMLSAEQFKAIALWAVPAEHRILGSVKA